MNTPQKKLLGPQVLTKHLKKANIIFTHYFKKKKNGKRILPTSFYESVITLIPKLDNQYKKRKKKNKKTKKNLSKPILLINSHAKCIKKLVN